MKRAVESNKPSFRMLGLLIYLESNARNSCMSSTGTYHNRNICLPDPTEWFERARELPTRTVPGVTFDKTPILVICPGTGYCGCRGILHTMQSSLAGAGKWAGQE